MNELEAGAKTYGLSPLLRDAAWIKTEPDPPEMVLRRELGPGETAVIAYAFKNKADLVVLDDLNARLVAVSVGRRLTGTLGILIAAHETGLLPDLRGAVNDLQKAGFRIAEHVIGALFR